jgi:peptidoglycan/LPS O-acetylase OafA/YrhL
MLFAIFALADIFVHTIYVTPFNLQIHRLALIFNIPILFLLADYYCRHGLSSKLLPNAAFIVFSVHYPIVVIIRKACVTWLSEATDLIHIPLYFVCVIITLAFSLLFYYCIDKYCPRIKNILSGNR